MSGIGNIGSGNNLFTYLQKQTSTDKADDQVMTQPSIPTEAQREAHLDQALKSAGVDDETAAAIESELKTAFEKIQSSGQFPPDRETMKQTVDAIFSKYGLDAKTVFGRSHGCSESTDSKSGTSNKNAKSLLDLLDTLPKRPSSPDDLSKLLSDALTGFDESA